jgi:[NiFe] hydrogenase diaphorase moiety large subunit
MLRETQSRFGYIPEDSIDSIALELGIHRVEVEGVVSFYHFLSAEQRGRTGIYLTKGALPSTTGVDNIRQAFETELGVRTGEVTPDGAIGLHWTSCIGMCDQEPAALINGVVVTKLTPDKVKKIVGHLKSNGRVENLITACGDGRNASNQIHAMVENNIRRTGDVIFADREIGSTIRELVNFTPSRVLNEIKQSNLRGRGGAGFPTGTKWSFCLQAKDAPRYVVCNADEGEPGTFKDRVILTERPELLFEGMVVAAYALNSPEGILYLRSEYEYLRNHLENVLANMRSNGLLGTNIGGLEGFDFDIHIQMGAGAYICGEETALLESAEGKRGDPRDRPPYPVSFGYKGKPTAVNNVETLCCAARIIQKGAKWFASIGTERSAGTKLLSVSGDCNRPGVYEVPFGVALSELLDEVGANGAQAVQVGGPSGTLVAPSEFSRKIGFEDLATGGAIIVIGQDRDLLKIVRDFTEFFCEESCGRCTPCRVGNRLMLNSLDKIIDGRGGKNDIEYIRSLGKVIKSMSRCGLGQTATNPVLQTLAGFSSIYDKVLTGDDFTPVHDLAKAVELGRLASGRS